MISSNTESLLAKTPAQNRIVAVLGLHPDAGDFRPAVPEIAILDLDAWQPWQGRDPREAMLLHAMRITTHQPGTWPSLTSEAGCLLRPEGLTRMPIDIPRSDTAWRLRSDDPSGVLLRHPATQAALAAVGRTRADIAIAQPTSPSVHVRLPGHGRYDRLVAVWSDRLAQRQKSFDNSLLMARSKKILVTGMAPVETGLRILGRATMPGAGKTRTHRAEIAARTCMIAALDSLLDDGELVDGTHLQAARWAVMASAAVLAPGDPTAATRGLDAISGADGSLGWYACASPDHAWTHQRWRRAAARRMIALEVERAGRQGHARIRLMMAGAAVAGPMFETLIQDETRDAHESLAMRAMDAFLPDDRPRTAAEASAHTTLMAARIGRRWQDTVTQTMKEAGWR